MGRELRPTPASDIQWTDNLGFSSADVARALGAKKNLNTAPGPDSFKADVWRKVPAVMLHCLAGCFTICMKHGIFPSRWKMADLVLIPKGEVSPGELPRVRPICLLDEVGKTFERLIAMRLLEFMNGCCPLADCAELQFGFRKRRSRCPAICEEDRG